IEANGSKGKAELSIPVASFARHRLLMDRWLRELLIFFNIFLVVLVVLIAGPIVRESTVPPGEAPQARNRRRARIVTSVALIVAVAILYLGRVWWNVEEAAYDRNVDQLKPP